MDNVYLVVGIFVGVYLSIIFRNIKGRGIPIWLAMFAGAIAMVFSGVISVSEAYNSINLEVIIFLFSMLVFVTSMDLSHT